MDIIPLYKGSYQKSLDPNFYARKFRISYTILTTPRKEQYLENTVQSLYKTGFFNRPENLPLQIVSGAPDSSHLRPFLSDPSFVVDQMSEEEAREFHWHGSGVPLRVVKGHRRCLHPLRAIPGASFVMVMEDDIRFAQGWIQRLERTLEEITARFSDRFLLSLYAPGSSEPENALEAYRKGHKWIQRSYDSFYGTQAILYPVVVRDTFMYETAVRPDDIKPSLPGKEMDRPYGLPYDLMLPAVMKALGIPILSTVPCLVQHVGRSTSINSPWHESASFLEKV